MPEVAGYVIGERLITSPRSVVWRAVEIDSGQACIVKLHRATWPTTLDLARTRHGFAIGSSLSPSSRVIEHRALVPVDGDLALVMADRGGTSLDRVLEADGAPGFADALAIGAETARALAEIHAAGVVHNHLEPSHILLSAEAVSIAGFGDATRLRAERPGSQDVLRRDVDLRYISPEQTGRMNRSVDSRSDLYALGVILFELLVGHPPFDASDPMALVHAHIARRPPELDVPGVPDVVAAIVAALLAKNAEDRYQEARAVALDLGRASEQVRMKASSSFHLGVRDVSERLTLPETLYGREDELGVLGESLARAAAGEQVLVLVSGYSGVGKTRLILELDPQAVERQGWFVAGKFDVFRRNVPYFGWIAAMREAIRQALFLPEDRLGELRADLLERLSGNGAALTGVAPEMEMLLGPQPALPEATPGEALVRFNQAFRALINGFARPDHPLVVFLDDLQWADLPSLRLLESLLSDPDASHVLVVGAWRDNEVGPEHPLMASIRHFEDTGVEPIRIDLEPLPPEEVHRLITDTVRAEPAQTEALASRMYDKTGGNPFFLRGFIEELHRDGLLVFDQETGHWTWNVDRVGERAITDNVADLMARRLADYPAATQRALQVASCIGPTFSLGLVASAGDLAPSDALRALGPALTEGSVVPLGTSYRYAGSAIEAEGSGSAIDPSFAFLHDRVQETAHESLSDDERGRIHTRIARIQIAATPADELDPVVVDIASHLLRGIENVSGAADRLEAAGLFLRAARQAKASMATDTARTLLDAAIDMLPADVWQAHRSLGLAIYTEAADVAYVEERFADAEQLAATALEHAEGVLERVPIHNIRIGIGVTRAAYHDATLYAVKVLQEDFGIDLAASPSLAHVMAGLVRLRAALRGKSTESLLGLPPMTDPEAQAAMAILMKTATNAYWAIPNLVPLIAFRMIRLTLARGSTGLSAYGYALYGMICSAALGEVDTGYAYGRLAMDLLERLDEPQLVGKTALLWHGFIRHTRDPLRLCGADVLDAYHAAMDAGDVENAAYCSTVAFYMDLLGGRSLGWIRERHAPYVTATLRSGQTQTIYALQVWLQVVENLSRTDVVVSEATGDHIDFEPRLAELLAEEKGNAIPQGVSGAGWLAFMLDDMERAQRHLGLLWKYRADAPGQVFDVAGLALYAVVLARREHAGKTSVTERLRAKRVRRFVAKRATHNPHDYAPFVAFIGAERAAGVDASARFLDTAELAHEAGLPYLEALALERAADGHREAGHRAVAEQIMSSAKAIWRDYGANARLVLLGEHVEPAGPSDVQNRGSIDQLGTLDVRTLLDSVHAVSGEIRLEGLLERIMRLAVQNAGARHGLLVLYEDDELVTVAAADVDDAGLIVVETGEDVGVRPRPNGIIDYVVRTHEAVVLDDAATDRAFARDPYMAERSTLSVLCTPLLRAGKLVGALYLDNELGLGVFTMDHLAIIETIGSQAAVSIENARLFEEQRSQAEAFSRFVPRPFLESLGYRRVTDVALGDAATADLVVLFSDLREFTRLSERLSAQEIFELLNEYFGLMEPLIHDRGGFIDKFIGDAVMALFIDDPDGAVAAGIQMHRTLRASNETADADHVLAMGIGLHAGPVMLGTVGSARRMDTTVIGDTVNTASRIEAMTKRYATPLLLSSSVKERLRAHVSLREAGRVRVKGKSESVTVHEVIDARPAHEADALLNGAPVFAEALAGWYRAEFIDAGRAFATYLEDVPFDGLAARYVELCRAQAQRPIPQDWDGVDVLTEK